MYMEATHTEGTIPFPMQEKKEINDLSNELEQQLNQQLENLNHGPEIPKEVFSSSDESLFRSEEGLSQPEEEDSVRKTAAEKNSEKTVSLINESKFLRYIADLRKADSELALAKAESAELVLQMNNYKKHYEEYEEIIQQLINKHDRILAGHIKTLTGLAQSIENNSDSLSSRIDDEIRRLTESLSQSIEGSVKKSCDEELARVEEATKILYDYSEKVKEQYIKFQKMEKVKFGLFIISSVSAPIVLVLMILNMMHII